jgi:hypothetical protein
VLARLMPVHYVNLVAAAARRRMNRRPAAAPAAPVTSTVD